MGNNLRKLLSLFLSFSLIFEQAVFAQSIDLSHYFVRNSGQNIPQSDKFRPLHLRYLGYDNLGQDFKILLDKGDTKKEDLENKTYIEENTQTLLKYFFIGLALPNDKFWVNLRPDAPDNIIDDDLAKTDVGKILLEADLQLKKDTARLTSPETSEGKEYWGKLYKKAEELFGHENITIPTLTRPWIVPGEIIIRESSDSAYIYKATLKVMIEQDYLKDSAAYSFKDLGLKQLNEYSSQLIKEIIIPRITKEVNNSKRYASLRQIYYSLIMAQWFKARNSDRDNASARLIDREDLINLTSKEPWSKMTYFEAYQKSFKDGEYNVKEQHYTPYGQAVRSYFSGGMTLQVAVPNRGDLPTGAVFTMDTVQRDEPASDKLTTPITLQVTNNLVVVKAIGDFTPSQAAGINSILMSNEKVGRQIKEIIKSLDEGVYSFDDSALWEEKQEKLKAMLTAKMAYVKNGNVYGHPEMREIVFIKLPGLLNATGQFAHIGLGQSYGRTVVYIDANYTEHSTVEGHEFEEIALWNNALSNELSGKVKSLKEVRAWMKENLSEAVTFTEWLHIKANKKYDIDALARDAGKQPYMYAVEELQFGEIPNAVAAKRDSVKGEAKKDLLPAIPIVTLQKVLETQGRGDQLSVIKELLGATSQEVRLQTILEVMSLSPMLARQVFDAAVRMRHLNPQAAAKVIDKAVELKTEGIFPILLELAVEPPIPSEASWSQVAEAAISSLVFFGDQNAQIAQALNLVVKDKGLESFYVRNEAVRALGKLGIVSEKTAQFWQDELTAGAWNDVTEYTLLVSLLRSELMKERKNLVKIQENAKKLFELLKESRSSTAENVYYDLIELLKLGLDRAFVRSKIIDFLKGNFYQHINFRARLALFLSLYENEADPAVIAIMTETRDRIIKQMLKIIETADEDECIRPLDTLIMLKTDDEKTLEAVLVLMDKSIETLQDSDIMVAMKGSPNFLERIAGLLGVMGKKHAKARDALFKLLEEVEYHYNAFNLRLTAIRSLRGIYGDTSELARRLAPYVLDESPHVAVQAVQIVFGSLRGSQTSGFLLPPLTVEGQEMALAVSYGREVSVNDLKRPKFKKVLEERNTQKLMEEFLYAGNQAKDLFLSLPRHLYGLNIDQYAAQDPRKKLKGLVDGLYNLVTMKNEEFRDSELVSMFGISMGAAQFILRKAASLDKDNVEVVTLDSGELLLRRKETSKYDRLMNFEGKPNSWTEVPMALMTKNLAMIDQAERNNFLTMSEEEWLIEIGFRRIAEGSFVSVDGYLHIQTDVRRGISLISADDYESPILFDGQTTLLQYNKLTNTVTLLTNGQVVEYYGKNNFFGDKPGSLRQISEVSQPRQILPLSDEKIQMFINEKTVTAAQLLERINTRYIVNEIYVIESASLTTAGLEKIIAAEPEKSFHVIHFNGNNYLFVCVGEENKTSLLYSKRVIAFAHDHPGENNYFPSLQDISTTENFFPDIPAYIIDRGNKRLVRYSTQKPVPFDGNIIEIRVGRKRRFFVNSLYVYPKYILKNPPAVPYMQEKNTEFEARIMREFSAVDLFSQDGFRMFFPAGIVLEYNSEVTLAKVFVDSIKSPYPALSSGQSSSPKNDPYPDKKQNTAKGGIDFRSFPIVSQAIRDLSANISTLSTSRLNVSDLSSEWYDIQKLVNSGITPSTERIKEYLQASCLQDYPTIDTNKIILCISNILRTEEESCSLTDPILRDILIVLQSTKSNSDLKSIFIKK